MRPRNEKTQGARSGQTQTPLRWWNRELGDNLAHGIRQSDAQKSFIKPHKTPRSDRAGVGWHMGGWGASRYGPGTRRCGRNVCPTLRGTQERVGTPSSARPTRRLHVHLRCLLVAQRAFPSVRSKGTSAVGDDPVPTGTSTVSMISHQFGCCPNSQGNRGDTDPV